MKTFALTKTHQPCSAETAAELYRLLEYYRNFMPFCLGMSEADYAATQEAINADAALSAYRDQTGTVADLKPSESLSTKSPLKITP